MACLLGLAAFPLASALVGNLADTLRVLNAPFPEIKPATFDEPRPAAAWDAPYFLEKSRLEQAASASRPDPAAACLLRQAQEALTAGPFSVVWKTGSAASGDPHDYASICPYFWPTPFLPGGLPYHWRDGRVNPEARSARYDRTALLELTDATETLALAYRLTGEEAYATRAALLLRVWFLDPATRMNPHFQYAQAIPGITEGYTLGLIRGVELVRLIDASSLLESSPAWSGQDRRQFRSWFASYLQWATEGAFGKAEAARGNNHGTWYDSHASAIACYVGREDLARSILQAFPSRRLQPQIAADGRQPAEASRSDGLYYSIYNLQGLYAGARLAERFGFDYWDASRPEGSKLEKATAWIVRQAAKENLPEMPKETRSDLISLLSQAMIRYPHPETAALLGRLRAASPKDRSLVFWPPPDAESFLAGFPDPF